MMKSLVGLLLVFGLYTGTYAQKATKDTLTASGNIQLTNNGVSPVPAFALNEPAVIGNYTLRKGRFYHQAILSFAWNAKPWNTLYRFGYDVVSTDKWKLSLASYLSFYFARRATPLNDEEFQLQRYHDLEIYLTHLFSEKSSLTTTLWYEHSLDKVGIDNAQLFMTSYNLTDQVIFKNLHASLGASLFYVHNAWNFQGLFVSQVVNFQIYDWKFKVFIQATEPIPVKNMQGHFLWNTGLNFLFN